MDDFETENFRDILNTENLKDDAYDDLKFDDNLFQINDELDDQDNNESDNESIQSNESGSNNDDNDDFLGTGSSRNEEPRSKARDEETEKLESLLNDDKSKDNEYDDLMYRISSNYDKIKILNDGDLPSIFPAQTDIKTVKHARQVYRLTNKKLNSMMVNDALIEFIPMIGDILGYIFNGERSIFGHKPDVTGYSLKLRTKLSNCNTDISTMSDKIVRIDFLSSCIKLLSIFGIPLYTTIKENSERSRQGLKKEKLIELNNKN